MQLSLEQFSYYQQPIKPEESEYLALAAFECDIESQTDLMSALLPPSPGCPQFQPGCLLDIYAGSEYSPSSHYWSNHSTVQSSGSPSQFSSGSSYYTTSPVYSGAELSRAAPTPNDIHTNESPTRDYSPLAPITEDWAPGSTSLPTGIPSPLAGDNGPSVLPSNDRGRKVDSTMERPRRKYKCPSCDHVSSRKFNLESHMKTHLPDEIRERFHCSYESCQKSYTRRSDLKRHSLDKHPSQEGSSSSSPLGATRRRTVVTDCGCWKTCHCHDDD